MFSNFFDIPDSDLGAKVKDAHQKHLEYVESMSPIWKEEGNKIRAVRESLDISRNEISEYVGVCTQVIAKFEKGKSVRSRNMLKQSYQTSLELIQLKRNSQKTSE